MREESGNHVVPEPILLSGMPRGPVIIGIVCDIGIDGACAAMLEDMAKPSKTKARRVREAAGRAEERNVIGRKISGRWRATTAVASAARSLHRLVDGSVEPSLEECTHMANRSGNQKGPQQHAEGQQGEKTHAAFLKGRHSGSPESEAAPQGENDADVYGQPKTGHHRLDEDREQHDEAEKNSENNKLRG